MCQASCWAPETQLLIAVVHRNSFYMLFHSKMFQWSIYFEKCCIFYHIPKYSESKFSILKALQNLIVKNKTTPTRMEKIQNINNIKCWTIFLCWWKCKMKKSFWKTIWHFLTRINVVLPYNPESHCKIFIQMSWTIMSTKKPAYACL